MSIETKLNLLHDEVLPLKRDHKKLLEDIDCLCDLFQKLEVRIINIEYQLSKIRTYIPEMRRLTGENFTVVSNDEAKRFNQGIVDRDTEFTTPTKAPHGNKCHECNPGWDGSDPEC
jgi:hypothetical protein